MDFTTPSQHGSTEIYALLDPAQSIKPVLKSHNAGLFHPLSLRFSFPTTLLKSESSSVCKKTDVAVADDMTELPLADRLKLLRSKQAEIKCELFHSIDLNFAVILMGDI